LTEQTFKLQPLNAKIRSGARIMADLLNRSSDQRVELGEDLDYFTGISTPLCWRGNQHSGIYLAWANKKRFIGFHRVFFTVRRSVPQDPPAQFELILSTGRPVTCECRTSHCGSTRDILAPYTVEKSSCQRRPAYGSRRPVPALSRHLYFDQLTSAFLSEAKIAGNPAGGILRQPSLS
jgi:hypothetical protein